MLTGKNLPVVGIMLGLFVVTFSCPENCNSCGANAEVCEVCAPGYELSEETFLCDLSYTHQQQWQGVCKTGTKQSPVNINSYLETLCPPGAKFQQQTLTVETSINPAGENLKAAYVNQSTVSYKVGGVDKTFNSLQFHWHHPSEHTVDGKYLDVELHIVHSNTDGSGNLAVTGLFFKVDKSMDEDILDKYNFFADGTSHPFTFPLFMKNHLVYHYEGSLTTPPCSQIVDWFVYTEYFPITEHNFQRIVEHINLGRSNSRKTQGLNGREMQIVGGFCNGLI